MPASSLPVSLPASANLEHLKKQAKDLLAALRRNDPAAHARWHTVDPQHSQLLSSSVPAMVSLSHAQFVLAREYGFASWPRLKRHVEALAAARQAPSAQSPADAADAASRWDALLRAGPAFARLTDAERQAIPPIHTAQWRVITPRYSEDGTEEHDPPSHGFSRREYIRFDPPAHANYQDFTNSWSHNVRNERGSFHTASSWDVCSLYPHQWPFTAAGLLKDVLFAPPASEENVSGSLPASHDRWQSASVEVDGRALIRWHQETVEGNFRVARSVWTEAATHRIMRREQREINLLTGEDARFTVHDRYIYDAPPPDGAFEMPPDKPIVTIDTRGIMPEVWDTLSPAQRQSLQRTINLSDAGWRKADFAAFGAGWAFGAAGHLPPESEWQERVQKQAGMWREWNSEITSVNTQPFVPVTVATNSYRWQKMKDGAQVKNEFLRVKVKLRVTWGEDGGAWEGAADFFLRRKGRGYKIAHWECPWAEIESARVEAESA